MARARSLPMLSLPQVAAFVAVIEEGTFQAAATRLGLSQATVSQHVRNLEDSLGATLVVRSRVRCAPTSHAAAFLRSARALLRLAERAEQSMKTRPTLVGASGNVGVYLLQPHVRRFIEQDPSAPALDLTIAPNPELAERLEAGTIDLAVMEWWDNRPGFTAQPWRSETMVVIAAPTHPWAGRKTVTKDELLDAALIGGEPGTGTSRLLRDVFGPAAADLKTTYTLGSTEAVKSAVKAGLGVSLVIASAVEAERRAGTLHTLTVENAPLAKQIVIVQPNDTPATALSSRFAAMLTKQAA